MWLCSRRGPASVGPNSGMIGASSASCGTVRLAITTPDPAPARQHQIVGIDVGSRYLATVATLDNRAQFYSGKETRAQSDHYARLQKRLQRKGARSATRRRIALGQADETAKAEHEPHDQQ